jgi:hypothetical protein
VGISLYVEAWRRGRNARFFKIVQNQSMRFLWLVIWGAACTALGESVPHRIIQLFDQHPLIGLGELHRNATEHAFIQQLLHDPSLTSKTRDIVVEFGNAFYQPTADKYVAGQPVPRSELVKIWRNTTMFMPWDVPEYEAVFRTIREVNGRLPRSRRIRVHLGDPPIDWSTVHTAADFEKFAKRDTFYFSIVDRLLASKRKALLIYGAVHFLKKDVRGPDAGPAREPLPELAQRYGAQLFSIWPVTGPSKLVQPTQFPDLLLVHGTSLGKLSSKELFGPNLMFFRKVNGKQEMYSPPADTMPRLGDVVDALLFVSPSNVVTRVPKSVFKDTRYLDDLKRRAPILQAVFGMDFLKSLEDERRESLAGK